LFGRFVKDLATYLPAKLLPALTAFISAPILTRLFLPAEYGNYALAAGFSDFLFALSCSGIGSGAVRFFPAYKVKSEISVFFATLITSVGIAIGVVSAVSSSALFLLGSYLPAGLYALLWISILIFIVQAVFTVFMEVVRSQDRSGLYTCLELMNRYGSLGLGLLLVIGLGFGVAGLLWGNLLALSLVLPVVLFLTTRGVTIRRQHFRRSDGFQMWKYAWPLALGNMAFWGLRLSDRYIISLFRAASEVGLYSVAYSISEKSIDMLVALFLLSMGPMIMNTWESQGREATEKALAMITRLYLILVLPAAVGLSLLAFPFMALFTSKAYHEGYRIVGYVAFSGFMWGLSQIAGRGLLIYRKTGRFAFNLFVAASVNLVLNLLLLPRYGFVVAGLTTLVGYTILLALQAYASRPYLTWKFPFRSLRNVVISTVCMGATILGIYSLSGNWKTLRVGYLFFSIIAAIIVYFISLLLLKEANKEEWSVVNNLWCKLQQKDTPRIR
jgi:O-antigen/teichoic acid export membrane protein